MSKLLVAVCRRIHSPGSSTRRRSAEKESSRAMEEDGVTKTTRISRSRLQYSAYIVNLDVFCVRERDLVPVRMKIRALINHFAQALDAVSGKDRERER